ncbi:monovalent cation/H(+) antiporter subunit G [Noviherbaspirillum sp.]|uniref:monovalent cation/H(+) antiporter subunit G n=1 Tax=Noviherbaspirillum sp. TaxID=1926288 RepID=UPI002B484FDD|nr:monovalent cation/H(+) antiporter subunit G [Noviherbaspirillum sp.]HJV82349.1 monovalent cation/H(+) antiporter subunit G [Noviherbaspirillum sp.]
MNEIENISTWAALAITLMLVVGGSFILIGAFGLMRLPSFYQRIHGPAVTMTLGTAGVLLASMLYFTVLRSRLVMHEAIIAMFVIMTAPVVSMLLMRAAVYRDLRTGQADRQSDADKVYGTLPKE